MRRIYFSILVLCIAAGCGGELDPEGRRLLQTGKTAYAQGAYGVADRDLTAFLDAYSRSNEAAEALYYRGLARRKTGDLDGAAGDLRKAAEEADTREMRGKALVALGDVEFEANRTAGAERAYREALEGIETGRPPADRAHFQLGRVLQRQGRWEDADLQFDRVMYLFENTSLAERAASRVRGRAWTIQIGAFRERARAEALADRAEKRGMPAVVSAATRGGAPIFPVHVGRHATYEQAERALPAVRGIQSDAFITTTR